MADSNTTLAKLAEIDRVITAANNLLRLQSAKAVPCQWKIRAFLQGRAPYYRVCTHLTGAASLPN